MKEKRRVFIIRIVIFVCIVMSLLMILFFCWKQDYDVTYPVLSDKFGQFGDFVGGVIGTLLSVVLLYFTFQSQTEDSQRNSEVFRKQQFNETFFYLLNQYHRIVESFTYISTDENLKGKEALHRQLVDMQDDFSEGGLNKGRKLAVEFYMNFYSLHRDFAPIYFRVLYRIFDLINNSIINEQEKVKYAKIIRAQISDSEIIMIRYNAMTLLGKKMRKNIVVYNLLKHMPPLELLEYDRWRNLFTESLRGKVNVILYVIRKNIHNLSASHPSLALTSIRAKYNVNVSQNESKDQILLNFNRRTNVLIPNYDNFFSFEAIPIDAIAQLFEEWVREIFVFSRFNVQGLSNSINIKVEFDRNINHNEHFTITIKNKLNKALII